MRKSKYEGGFPPPVENEDAECRQWMNLCRRLAWRTVKNKMSNISHGYYSYEMAFGDAMMGLLYGVRTYDSTKNDNKMRYYSMCIMSHIGNGSYRDGEFVHSPSGNGLVPTQVTDDILKFDVIDDDEGDERKEILHCLNNDFSEDEIACLTMDDWHWARSKWKHCNRNNLYMEIFGRVIRRLKENGMLR